MSKHPKNELFFAKIAGQKSVVEITEGPSGNGVTPVNPLGMCFDLVGFQAIGPEGIDGYRPPTLRICHGIGIANYPGQEGTRIGHAWLEWQDAKKGHVALDTTYQVCQPAEHYRKSLQLEYVVEYTFKEFVSLWAKYDIPGPFDPKIKAVISILALTHATENSTG